MGGQNMNKGGHMLKEPLNSQKLEVKLFNSAGRTKEDLETEVNKWLQEKSQDRETQAEASSRQD